jgi:O-antigen/teichoic acid export membrane protein
VSSAPNPHSPEPSGSLGPVGPVPPDGDEAQRRFINRALGFTAWENTFKLVAPLMELLCAALFVGGAWGRFKFFESLAFVVFRISLMGMDKGVIWYYSNASEDRYLRTIFRSLAWCLMAWALLSTVAGLAHAGVLPAGWILGSNAESFGISARDLALYLAAVPLMMISELCIQANVNKRNLKYRILVPGITVPLTAYGLAAGGYWLAPGALSLPLCFFLGHVAGSSVAMTGFFRAHKPQWRHISLMPTPPWKMIRYSAPLAMANIFSALAVRVDIFMLAGLTGVKGVEIYAVVTMVGKSLISIRQSFENILLSAFSSSGVGKLTTRVKHYFNYAVWMVMGIQGALLFVAVLFGAELLGLVNPQYATGYVTLLIVAGFIYINTTSDFLALLTLGLGKTSLVPVVQAVFFGTNIVLNMLWIPLWDSAGAALALGVANLVSGLIYLVVISRLGGGMPFERAYWKSIIGQALWVGGFAGAILILDPAMPTKIGFAALFLLPLILKQKKTYRAFNRRMRPEASPSSQEKLHE